MLKLHTLGSVFVAREDGRPLNGAAGQRRLLALLTLLSAAGDAGLSRDKILGLLWPDGDPERARHALTQSLYHARRALGCDDLFLAATDVRLNPERLTSDLQELDAALAAGDMERAVALYAGPFLDGFFLSGSAEFERWASAQRAVLTERVAQALERLATAAEKGGDHRQAVEWRKRLVSLDPLDSTATARLMSAMAAAGDRAGALQQGRIHETLLREQLEVGPPAAVTSLIERLRDDAAWQPGATPSTPSDGSPAVATVGAPAAALARSGATLPHVIMRQPSVAHAPAAPDVAVAPPREGPEPADVALPATGDERAQPAPDQRGRRPVRRRWRWLAGFAALAATLALGIVLGRRGRGESLDPVAPVELEVVVAPFRVTGADASLAYLREGLVELLSTRLADDAEARSMDPGSVLRAWRHAGLTGTVDVPRAAAVDLASQLGARHVVVGSVVGSPSHIVVSASLVDVPAGTAAAQATVEGPADSLTSLVDRLAALLIASEAGEGDRLASHTTPSLAALRAFLEGQAAYRRGSFAQAMNGYSRALRLDSTFALAALQLALSADRLDDVGQHDRALALAWAARDELTARDRAHLVAFAGPRYPAPSSDAELLAAWERAVALAPDRAEVWHEMGERLFHDGAVLGLPDAETRAQSALQRALALDPAFAPSRRLLALLAARAGDTAALRRVASPAALRDSMGALAPFVRWRVALARHDEGELRRVRAELPRFDRANLRAIALAGQYEPAAAEDGARALRFLRARATLPGDEVDVLLGEHSLALAQGRWADARAALDALAEAQPTTHARLRLRVLDALYAREAPEDDAGADSAAAELGRLAEAPVDTLTDTLADTLTDARAVRLADVCVLEQWRLAHGVTRTARRSIDLLRQAPSPREPVLAGTGPQACAEMLDAALAVATHRRNARDRVTHLDSLMLAGPAVGDGAAYAPLFVARLFERLGDPERALEALQHRTYLTGWPRYRAMELRGARRLERAGQNQNQ